VWRDNETLEESTALLFFLHEDGGPGSPISMVPSTKYAASHAKRLQSQNSSRTLNSSGMWHCCGIG